MSLLDYLNPLKIFLDPIEKVSDAISRAQIAKANAATDQERLYQEERVKGLEMKRDVLVKESPDSPNARMRNLIAAPVAILLWKVFVWDKALGQWTGGHTDALSPQLWTVIMYVLGFYFLFSAAKALAEVFKRR